MINSNSVSVSHCFRDMASFPLKNAHFPTLFHLIPSLKMFPIALDRPNFVRREHLHMANYSYKKL